jgi:hypothetical protein
MTIFSKEGPIDNNAEGNDIIESHADHAENCDEDEDNTESPPVAPRCASIDDATTVMTVTSLLIPTLKMNSSCLHYLPFQSCNPSLVLLQSIMCI